MEINLEMQDSFEDTGDFIALYDELGSGVVYNAIYGVPVDKKQEFLKSFKILPEKYLGDPKEDYYQGIKFTRLIQRISDDKLFGFTYWVDISKHGEAYVEPNGDKFGYDFDWTATYFPEVFVFTPVKPFTVQGYETEAAK